MTDDMRLRAATTSEIERVRQIERASASRFVGTARAALADDEPTDGATLTQRIAAGGLLVAMPVCHFRPISMAARSCDVNSMLFLEKY